MGSRTGSIRTAAAKHGLTVEEYEAKTVAEKWCTGCKAWHPRSDFPRDRHRGDGLRARCLAADRGKPRTVRDPAKVAARVAVQHAVRFGRLPHPGSVPCTDCGHTGDDRRHEYDHHHGYDVEHHLDVEPVCTTCHADRERGRLDG